MSMIVIQPDTVQDTRAFSYSHAVRMGDLIFVAGQVAHDADENLADLERLRQTCIRN